MISFLDDSFSHYLNLRHHSVLNFFNNFHNILIFRLSLRSISCVIYLLFYFIWLLNLIPIVFWLSHLSWLFEKSAANLRDFLLLLINLLLFFRLFSLFCLRCKFPNRCILANLSSILFVFSILSTDLFHISIPMLSFSLLLDVLNLLYLSKIRFDLTSSLWTFLSCIYTFKELVWYLSSWPSIFHILFIVAVLNLTLYPLIKLVVACILKSMFRRTWFYVTSCKIS